MQLKKRAILRRSVRRLFSGLQPDRKLAVLREQHYKVQAFSGYIWAIYCEIVWCST